MQIEGFCTSRVPVLEACNPEARGLGAYESGDVLNVSISIVCNQNLK